MSEFDRDLRALAHIKTLIDRPENKYVTVAAFMHLVVSNTTDLRTQMVALLEFLRQKNEFLERREQIKLASEIDSLWADIVPRERKRK